MPIISLDEKGTFFVTTPDGNYSGEFKRLKDTEDYIFVPHFKRKHNPFHVRIEDKRLELIGESVGIFDRYLQPHRKFLYTNIYMESDNEDYLKRAMFTNDEVNDLFFQIYIKWENWRIIDVYLKKSIQS